MDRASRALARGVPADVPRSYRALADHGGVPRSTLHHRAQGRPSIESKAQKQQYLTPAEEKAVVDFIIQMSALGHPVRIKYIPSLAFSATRHRPESDQPVKPPGKNWARALEKRHPALRAKRVRALDWNRHEKNIYEKTRQWFEVIRETIQGADVVAENVYNMDETGVMLSMPGSVKVLMSKADARDYRGAQVKRETVTAIECISADGRALSPMIIWPATTHRSHWTTFPTPGWHYACSESGYTDSFISLEWLRRVFDPQTKDRAGPRPRLLIWDGFGTHETLEILEHCFANNITLCRLPSHTSHKLQPCDISVFAPLKAAYRDNVEQLERMGVGTIGKQHFTSLYSPARERAFSLQNILAGWDKAGLFPFDPDRVLRDLPNPVVRSSEVTEDGRQRSLAVVQNGLSGTPITPVSVETLMTLQQIIVQQDASTLDLTSRQNLERHMQKLTRAASTFLATTALQKDQIRSLHQANSEADVRRATRSIVLGKGKVMSYDDLEVARARRAEKEANNDRKRRRGRRSQHEGDVPPRNALETAESLLTRDEDNTTSELARAVPCETQNAIELPWRAPVARMY